MLPKKHRLPLRTEWLRLKKEGQVFQSPLFGLVVVKRPFGAANSSTSEVSEDFTSEVSLGGEARFGFIVSKKISKKAVERNRMKRLLSEAVRSLLPQIKVGYEGVFLAKKAILGKGFREVENEVRSVLKRADSLKEE